MHRLFQRTLVVLCLAAAGACTEGEDAPEIRSVPDAVGAPTRVATPGGSGGFVVGQAALGSPQNEQWQRFVHQNQILEGYADVLNSWISLPEEVALAFTGCGEANAYFDEEERAIVMCYELLAAFARIFETLPAGEREEALMGATDFIFYHEVGHALIDVLKLPALGREEDVADQLAVHILTDGTEAGEQAAIDGAVALYRITPHTDEVAFADEHSLGPQRFYNIACWVYGQNPDRYGSLVGNGVLPEARAERCPDEYAQLESSWNRLLGPYLRQ